MLYIYSFRILFVHMCSIKSHLFKFIDLETKEYKHLYVYVRAVTLYKRKLVIFQMSSTVQKLLNVGFFLNF